MIKTTEENGGILGVDNTPTKAVASGIWGLNSVFDARSDGIWPIGGFYDYPIENSLRFDGTSSYLSKAVTGTGISAFTLSLWVKFSQLDIENPLLQEQPSGTEYDVFFLSTGNALRYISTDDGTTINTNFISNNLFRDTSAWYHFVLLVNSSTSLIKFFINGIEASYSSTTSDTRTTNYFQTGTIEIGRWGSSYLSGYLANIQFIDGQALNAHYFGEFKSGMWTPKAFDGTASDSNYTISGATSSYGTKGFRLAFNLSDFNTSGSAVSDPYGSATNLPDGYVADASGSGNHWQVN